MAFGKKKEKELALAVEAAAAELPPAAPISPPPEEEDDIPRLGSLVEVGADAAPALDAPAEPPAEAPAADALLSMFDTGELETNDLSAMLALAGDVDLDDLLEELHTVAAAIGIAIGERDLAA